MDSDEEDLNPGRDLRLEAYHVFHDAVAAAALPGNSEQKSVSLLMDTIEPWIGGLDDLFGSLGRPVPIRPEAVFEGASDALRELEPETMETSHALALLTVCHPVKKKIPGYANFCARCENWWRTTRPDDWEGLIQGLRPHE